MSRLSPLFVLSMTAKKDAKIKVESKHKGGKNPTFSQYTAIEGHLK